MRQRHPKNAPGDWYVDTRCTDCGAARHVAPGLIVRRDRQSVFARQPQTEAEIAMAWRARLLCPTASVRTLSRGQAPDGLFPEQLDEGIYRLGYNASSSYGAHSFLIRREAGNAMVDSPRFTQKLVKPLEAWGGLSEILLTHRDDVADAKAYAEHFGARVWIQKDDRTAAPFATNLLTGVAPFAIGDDLVAIPLPGHTKGSVAYLFDTKALFTGDSLAWSEEADELVAFRDYCWYSWEELTNSLARLIDYSFEWVLAGHGASKNLPADKMRVRLEALVERMRAEP